MSDKGFTLDDNSEQLCIKKVFAVPNRLGLHARTAARISELSRQFESDIECALEGSDDYLDSKSVLDLLMLGATQGQRLEFVFRGDDAQEACAALTELFANNLGEE